MYLHPVTLFIGIVSGIILLALTGTGLSCVVYKMDPTNHQYLEMLYNLAKMHRIC